MTRVEPTRDEDAWIGAVARRFPATARVRVGIGHDAAVVRFDGRDLYENLRTFRGLIGYVPQDDIVHADLPLQRMLLLQPPHPRAHPRTNCML